MQSCESATKCSTNYIVDSQIYRFIPCGHLSVHEQSYCAICYQVHTSKLLMAIAKANTYYDILLDDNHPYYGLNSIIRVRCLYSRYQTNIPGTDQSRLCNQEFFTTVQELIDNTVEPRRDCGKILDCHCGHIVHDNNHALYKIMIALEMYTRLRFDYPICVKDGGVRAAYSRELNLAILCDEPQKMIDQRAQIEREHTNAISIVCIDPNQIHMLWNEKNGDIYAPLFDNVIAPINRYVFSCAQRNLDMIKPASNDEHCSRMRGILESWRLLTKYAHYYLHDDCIAHPISKKSVRYPENYVINDDESYPLMLCNLDRAAYLTEAYNHFDIIRKVTTRGGGHQRYRATTSDAHRSASQLPRQ